MAKRDSTFAKRQRETELKERARAKAARRADKANQPKTTKGPEIDWSVAVYPAGVDAPADAPVPVPAPDDDSDNDNDSDNAPGDDGGVSPALTAGRAPA